MDAKDKYDSMAEIAGGAGGLDPKTWPGLAHILRQVARDEREACVKVVEAFKADMPERIDMIGYRTKIAARIRARENSK